MKYILLTVFVILGFVSLGQNYPLQTENGVEVENVSAGGNGDFAGKPDSNGGNQFSLTY